MKIKLKAILQNEEVRKILTEMNNLRYALGVLFNEHNGGEGMKPKGIIRVKGKCSSCGQNFIYFKKLGFICIRCKTMPLRFYIDLWWDKKRIRIFSDKTGQPLDSYQRAVNLLAHINYEIKNFSFDPSQYIKTEAEKFWTVNLLDKFLEHKFNSIAPSYQKDYIRMINIAKGFFKTKDVREVRKLDLVNYKKHLEKDFNFSNKTIKNILDVFKTFLRWCKNDIEVIDKVPAFPEIEVQEPEFKWLSQEDQIRLFELVPDRHRPIFAFLMLHGVRPSEARALKCKNVNLKTQTITISTTFSGRVYREKRKGKRSKPIVIPLHPEMIDYITERVKNNLPEAFLFVNKTTGQYYGRNTLDKIWNDVRKKAGISKDLRLYDATRHSFASHLVNSGVSLYKVSKLLGHSSTKMTEKYAHHHIESLRADLNKLSLKETKIITRPSFDCSAEYYQTVTRLSPEEK
jgi:integrase